MKQLRSLAAIVALAVAAAPAVGSAQLAIVHDPLVESNTSTIQNQQWQTYLKTVDIYKQQYDQLQIEVQNAKSFSVEDWVNIGSQARQIAASIRAQMNQPYGSAVAGAAGAQNQFLQQDVDVLTTIANMAPNAVGSNQRQQLANQLLMAIASENLKQRQLRLAQAQDDARREDLWNQFNAQQADGH